MAHAAIMGVAVLAADLAAAALAESDGAVDTGM